MTLVLNYPHDTRSHEPLLLTRTDIWRLAEEAHLQVGRRDNPVLDFADLVTHTRDLRINGYQLETRWDFADDVSDPRGHKVMGAIEYDPAIRRTALIYLNSQEVAGQDELVRSTAAHELAHAIFDAPGWMLADEKMQADGTRPKTSYRAVVRRYRSTNANNTMEWRANEFMGAFLAPPTKLRRLMLKALPKFGLCRCVDQKGRVVVDARKLGSYELQAVIDEMAEQFGVTIGFMEYRFHCYELARKAD